MNSSIRRKSLVFVSTLMMASVMSAVQADEESEVNYVTTPEIEWQQLPIGPEVWAVKGDFTQGAHVTYIKFNAGFKTPLHIHSSSYVGVVVAGTTRHEMPGVPGTDKLLPPGSHWYVPANVPHVSECLPGFECIMAIYQQDPFDFIALEESHHHGEDDD